MTSKTVAPAGDCAERVLAGLSRSQRIGQLLMVGLDAEDPTGVLPSLPVGGVFLAGKSTASADSVRAAIDSLQRSVTALSGVKAHVALDQEGGYVQSLRGSDFPAIASAVDQGQLGSAELTAQTTAWSKLLVQAGITLDLAPVADTVPAGTAKNNPPIGREDRQYGATPASVSASVVDVVKSMLAANLGTTVKHFPGLGRVRVNTDTSTGAVDSQTDTDDVALQPFRDAIAAHTTAVMMSSASYPQLDPDHVAAFSRTIITHLLRNTLHFGGLVISDDLSAAVAVAAVPVGQRAVDFIRAGGDMVLIVSAADLSPMTKSLTTQAAQDPSFAARINIAALSVLRSKESLTMLTCPSA